MIMKWKKSKRYYHLECALRFVSTYPQESDYPLDSVICPLNN